MLLALVVLGTALAAAPQEGASTPDTSVALTPSRYALDIRVDLAHNRLDAEAQMTAVNRSSAAVGSASLLLYRLLRVTGVRDATGAPLSFRERVVEFLDHPTFQARQLVVSLPRSVLPGDSTTIRITYDGYLLGYAETGYSYLHDRIDSTYSLIRMDTYAYPELRPPSHVIARRAGLPRYDYRARITVPNGYIVANGGELLSRRDSSGWTTFVFRNLKPAWRMDFAIAPFVVREEGTLRVYQLPADSLGGARVMRSMQRCLQLFTRWFGALRGQTAFALIEIPDGWGSQADVTSILETAAAFRDSLSVRELYHELSHLWNVPAADSLPPRWEEGLASFLEDLAVDSLNGRVTTDRNAQWRVDRLRERVKQEPRLRDVAPIDYGKYDMTDYSYSVGAVMFYVMYRVTGHDAFTRLVRVYYDTHAQTGGNTSEFMTIAKQLSPVPLGELFGDWLQSARWTDVIAVTDARQLVDRYRHLRSVRNP